MVVLTHIFFIAGPGMGPASAENGKVHESGWQAEVLYCIDSMLALRSADSIQFGNVLPRPPPLPMKETIMCSNRGPDSHES